MEEQETEQQFSDADATEQRQPVVHIKKRSAQDERGAESPRKTNPSTVHFTTKQNGKINFFLLVIFLSRFLMKI